jgi:hypothetical protein
LRKGRLLDVRDFGPGRDPESRGDLVLFRARLLFPLEELLLDQEDQRLPLADRVPEVAPDRFHGPLDLGGEGHLLDSRQRTDELDLPRDGGAQRGGDRDGDLFGRFSGARPVPGCPLRGEILFPAPGQDCQ